MPNSLPQSKPPATAEAEKKPDFSQEPFVIQDLKNQVWFERNGTGRRVMTAVILVNTELGVRQLGQLVFGYSSGNEKLDVDYVRIRKPDGSVITAGADAVQDLASAVVHTAPMYTDFRQKHITVPGLRPGDQLEYSITTTIETALAPNQFWFEYDFDREVIVLNEKLEITVPKDKPIKLKTEPGRDPEVHESGDYRIYTWANANLKHRTPEEIREDRRKRRRHFQEEQPSVQLTTFRSWQEVGAWYAPLQRERIQATPVLREKTAELIKDKKTDLEKIKAIYDFVAPEYRYVSLSFGLGRYQPHAAADIFTNRYGDCKDKHTLLEAMLAIAGIHADPVLINSRRRIDPDVPSPGQFDHVITLVTLGKQRVWLDSTTEVAPFQLLSFGLRHKQALWVPADGNGTLIETPSDSPVPNQQIIDVDAKIDDIGTLIANMHLTLRGDSELMFRYGFRSHPESEWKDLVKSAGGINGEISNLNVDNPTNTQKPFELRYTATVANYLDWSSKNPTFPVPLPKLSAPEIEGDEDEQPEQVELTGAPIEAVYRLKLEVPARYAVSIPLPALVSRDYASYAVTYKNEKNVITAERTLRLLRREIPRQRLDDYAAFRRVIESDQGQLVSLETSLAGASQLPQGLKADDLIAAGAAAMRNRNFPAAIESYKRATELEPKNKNAWIGLGTAYLSERKTADAIVAYRKVLEMNPYEARVNNGIAAAYAADHRWDESAAAFRKELEINPLDSAAHTGLAQVLLEQRKFSEALPELEKAASLEPRNAGTLTQLGRTYLEVGQQEKGLEALNKAVEIAPNSSTFNNVAYELARHKIELDRAQQYAESAVSEVAAQLRNVDVSRLRLEDYFYSGAIGSFWDTLGWVHFQRGNLEQAEKYITAAWLLTAHGESAYHLGRIYEAAGRKDDAIRLYASALAAKNSYPEAREVLTALLKNPKKVDEAIHNAAQNGLGIPAPRFDSTANGNAQADFAFVFENGPKIDGIKFLSGDEKLRSFASKLDSGKYPVAFPDGTPTKLVRRGTLSCGDKGCVVQLLDPEAVTSAD
ncbi:MAG TPA: DUF3857 domain-containing protein [Terriglobales bacterium]|nr:DUF3857 domain-containing protein [Terriglobales bacterium]